MKKALLLLLLVLPFTALKSQEKQLNKALNGNRDRNGCFVATFKQPQSFNDIKKWCNDHNQAMIDTTIGYIAKFGDVHEGVTRVSFMPKHEYEEIQRRLAAERAAQKEREAESSLRDGLALLGIAVGTGLLLIKGGEMILKSSGSGGGSYDYSGTSASQKNSGKKPEPAKASTPCYGKAEEYGSAFLRCNAKVKDKYYKIKCGDGSTKYYFYLPEKNNDGLCSDQIGYKEYMGRYLGADYDKAMRKLCNCD